MPELLPCDAVLENYGRWAVQEPYCHCRCIGRFAWGTDWADVFEEGLGKVTYGTGSSVMVNIGEKVATAPRGLVTSIGFAALGKVFYALRGIFIVLAVLSSGWNRDCR